MSYMDELDVQAKKDKKRFESKSKLNSSYAWNMNAYGSASCASGSYEMAIEAYNEYKSYEW